MSDSDYEEESVVTVVELKGIMNSDILFQEKPAKILAPESENPVLQFGDYIFRGEWQQTMGTVVCFEKPSEEKDVKDKTVKFVAKADKKLSLQRIFLEEKKESQNSATGENSQKIVNGNESKVKEPDLRNGHTSQVSILNGAVEKQDNANMHQDNLSFEGTSTQSSFNENKASGSGLNYRGVKSPLPSSSNERKDMKRQVSIKRCHPKDFNDSSESGSQDSHKSECYKLQETAGRVLSDVLTRVESTGRVLCTLGEFASGLEGTSTANGVSCSLVADTSNARDLNATSSSSICHKKDSVGVNETELVSETEDKSIGSSEADFIVLSEYSNEASCDAEGDVPAEPNEPADSSDEVCSTLRKPESFPVDCVESSGGEVGVAKNASEGNLVTVIVDSLLSEVQSMQCNERASSMSPLIHDDDVADSASSVEEGKSTQRHSDSLYPLVCDSASGEGTSHDRLRESSEDMDISTADCSDTFRISTSARISSSQYFPNVFEDEAMDTTENIERPPLGNEVDSAEVMDITVSADNEQNLSETRNFSEPQCSHKGGVVNSTVGVAPNASAQIIDLTERVSGSLEEVDSHVSRSIIPQNFSKSKDSGLIDSTSNKVCATNVTDGSNLKPIPGIDSTTNDSGRNQSNQDESYKRTYSNRPVTVNEKIDSTMNRVEMSAPPEAVDFEMREATNVVEVEDDDVCENSSIDDSEPIDSTSSIIQHTQNFCRVGNVSESSAVVLGESSRQSYIESQTNYSPCNVTESHIDDCKPLSSFVVSSPGSENLQSEIAESSERSSENLQDITESDSYEPQNFDIAESSLQDDSFGASSSQVLGPCGSSSYKNFRTNSGVDIEDDSVNKVTESTNSPSYVSNNSKVSIISTHEVTDSTNISYSSSHLSSEDFSDSPLVIIGDSTVCEVTESSSVVDEENLVVDESDVQDSFRSNSRHIHAEYATESPSSANVASGSDVTESRRFENQSFFNADNNSSSGDGKEPSSSGLNTSETNVSEACSSAGVVSTENEIYSYSSAGSQDLATNEASMSSSSVYWSSPLVHPSEYEISNSLEQGADSTEGENQSSHNHNTESSAPGGDNSKLPSSTSN